MERQETSRLLGNLPWRRLEADRKVTPHGQVLPRRNYGYGLTAKASLRSECVHHCTCPIFPRGCRPTRSEKTHAVSTHAVRITACIPFSWWFRRGQKRHTRGHCLFASAVCRQLLIRHGEQGMRSEKTHNPSRHYYLATGVLLMRWPTVIVTCHSQPTFLRYIPCF